MKKERLDNGLLGNIPTCVGKTRKLFLLCVKQEKHPHLRGENSKILS